MNCFPENKTIKRKEKRFSSNGRAESVIEVGKFSGVKELDGIPQGWELLTFKKIKKHTRYTRVVDEGIRVVKAVSNSSSSGLIRKISIDPKEYPIITWQWKITKIFEKGGVRKKQGDDYPVHIKSFEHHIQSTPGE